VISTYLFKLAEQTIIRLVSGPKALPCDDRFPRRSQPVQQGKGIFGRETD